MEFRASHRRPLIQYIVLNRAETYSRLCRTDDLSLDGAFVHLRSPDLAPDQRVEVLLVLRHAGRFAVHRVPANVVRVARCGVGLRFDPYDDSTYTALVNLLYA